MTRFALTVEFDGTPFMGLQRQPHDPSVQQAIEEAAHKITGERVTLFSAGRTDSGVHALAMRCHVDIAKEISPFRLMEALNAVLRPAPVAITHCEVKPEDWHARFSCTGRRYEYRIRNRRAPLTLEQHREWLVTRALDVNAMHEAAQILVGLHDFTTFRSAHCQSKDPVKTLDRLDVSREEDRVIVRAAARSFLRHQVRSMVGTIALVGMGQWQIAQVGEALAAKNRAALGLNAPPEGLYFVEALYPDDGQTGDNETEVKEII